MIRLLGKLPPGDSIVVACSGGSDSMAAASFLAHGGRAVTLAYFNHGTPHGEDAQSFVSYVASHFGWGFVHSRIPTPVKPPNASPEEFWRVHRYAFLHSLGSPVVTAHHLDDEVETWMFGALRGRPRLIPYRNGNVIRPFLCTRHSTLVEWCTRHGIPFVEDPSNTDLRFARNRIRHRIVPEALHVNPGLHTVVRKMVESEYKASSTLTTAPPVQEEPLAYSNLTPGGGAERPL